MTPYNKLTTRTEFETMVNVLEDKIDAVLRVAERLREKAGDPKTCLPGSIRGAHDEAATLIDRAIGA